MTTTGSSNDSSVPLADIAAILRTVRGQVEESEGRISFPAGQTTTTLEVQPVHLQTTDGLEVSEIVIITTVVPERDVSFNEEQIVASNMYSALSALVRDEKDNSLRMVNRLSAYKGDDAAWKLYAPVLAFAAALQGETFAKSLGQVVGLSQESLDIPEKDQPSPWCKDDFDAAVEPLARNGVFANAGETGLTAEFPLEAGAVSASFGDSTSLLTFKNDMPHPALGNGLFVKLALPMHISLENIYRIANDLNRVELESVDAVPFIGAWTVSPSSKTTLVYICFWPNFMYAPGLILNLAFWMGHRSRHARAHVENLLQQLD